MDIKLDTNQVNSLKSFFSDDKFKKLTNDIVNIEEVVRENEEFQKQKATEVSEYKVDLLKSGVEFLKDDNDELYVIIKDKNGEIIRQIPPEELRKMKSILKELVV